MSAEDVFVANTATLTRHRDLVLYLLTATAMRPFRSMLT